jgi:nucleotide-binding universal stress UspA family protein
MKRYERILICIDQPHRDSRILDYARTIVRLADSKELYLLHVSDDPHRESPDALAGLSPKESVTCETLQTVAAEHFEASETMKCRCEVIHGAPVLDILRFAYEKDVDLVVIGRHYGDAGAADSDAELARRITRKATCSVLVLPEDCQIKADTILVPVRDSDCSANALEVACGIATATGAAVIAFNTYQVHGGYARAGMNREQQIEALDEVAQRECRRLLERVDSRSVTVQCRCAPDLHGTPVPVVLETIRKTAADLAVIGARGRTGAAGVLLGAVTEQLIRKSPVPVLAVKKKGECIGILRALLTLAGEG